MDCLIFGCGYLGSCVAERWRAAGRRVMAITRRTERAAELRRGGIEPRLGDVTRPATLTGLPAVDTVLYAVGWDPRGPASRREVYVDGLRAVLEALPPPKRFLYISSTGVYGDANGGWVDEQSSCRPVRQAGRAFLEAEQILGAHEIGARAVVLRMAGIYGPGRLTRQAELLSGQPLAIAADSYMNVVHIDDAVEAVLAAEARATPPRTILVADGRPVQRREYFGYVAERLGVAEVRFVDPSGPGREERHDAGSKRVSNRRLLEELGLVLRYPSYREGLAAALPGR